MPHCHCLDPGDAGDTGMRDDSGYSADRKHQEATWELGDLSETGDSFKRNK